MLRDGFDVEAVSSGWQDDLDAELPSNDRSLPDLENIAEGAGGAGLRAPGGAIALYEDWIRDPGSDGLLAGQDADPDRTEIASQDPQEFLGNQLVILEAFRTKATEKEKTDSSKTSRATKRSEESGFLSPQEATDVLVSDHIGPVQFNMGGIQVDADDMLQRLKVSPSVSGAFDSSAVNANPLVRTGIRTAPQTQ